MALHILSTDDDTILQQCFDNAVNNDVVILIADACQPKHLHKLLSAHRLSESITIYSVEHTKDDPGEEKAIASIATAVEQIDYNGFLTLCTTHNQIISWY